MGMQPLMVEEARNDPAAMTAIHGPGINICGIVREPLSCREILLCDHCRRKRVHVRTFSGSGWFEDEWLCATCGENWGTGYHPFEKGWRKKATLDSKAKLARVVPVAEFRQRVKAIIANEMGWDE